MSLRCGCYWKGIGVTTATELNQQHILVHVRVMLCSGRIWQDIAMSAGSRSWFL